MARREREEFAVDIDLEHARREAERVRDMLAALRRRHDLSRFEYTSVVRIVPGGDTFAIPMLTLGNRFADNEDLLLSTYLHEQMHWYLWHLGTPERDHGGAVLRRAGAALSRGADRAARRRAQLRATYLHLVVNWLEMAATSEFIGRERACAVAEAQRTYRWIYRTVLRDWDMLGELYERHGLVPIRTRRGPATRERQGRASAPSTAAREKGPQQRAGPRLLDPAVDLRRVVAGRLAEDARAVLDAAALGVGRRRNRAGGCAQTRSPPRTSGRAPA